MSFTDSTEFLYACSHLSYPYFFDYLTSFRCMYSYGSTELYIGLSLATFMHACVAYVHVCIIYAYTYAL